MTQDTHATLVLLRKYVTDKIHEVMYQNILAVTGQRYLKRALAQWMDKISQEIRSSYSSVSFRGTGTWDNQHHRYQFYLQPDGDPTKSTKFLYGEIYVGSIRVLSAAHIVGYRMQIEDACQFFPIGILDKEMRNTITHLKHIRNHWDDSLKEGTIRRQLEELFADLQELYSHLEYLGEPVDGLSFAHLLREKVNPEHFNFSYEFSRHRLHIWFGGCELPINLDRSFRIQEHWYTRIQLE